ncbi:MAG TPA: SCO family protein [Thermoanaerobaculia bacterium]|nr:SCO family protein [Thermoanaerobaculia bacterium]
MDSSARTPPLRRLLWVGLLLSLAGVIALAVVRRLGEEGRHLPDYGTLPGFLLTNRDGREVSLGSLDGKPWLASFIFTRCPGPCPKMTAKMAKLGERLPRDFTRVSFSVDPEHDTPAVLAAYAERYQAPPSWLFLTGSREAIYELANLGFKLLAAPSEDPTSAEGPILHSTRFVLVDGEGRIRGYYNAFDPAEEDRLVAEAATLAR